MNAFVLNALNGISYGLILFLLASGLSLILGAMGIVNLTHGALYMIGAYVGWSVAVQYGLNFWLAVLAGGVAAMLVGLAIEEGFLRHLYKQVNDQVLLTVGFVFILTNLVLWVWGAVPKSSFTADFLSGSSYIMGLAYPTARLGIIFIGVALAVFLWWFQEKTRLGAMVRAGMDDKEMALGLGINFRQISTAIFSLGAFVAGVAGVIGAQLLGANLRFGFDILLLGLVIVVVGGMGSVQGALLGSILIGLVDSFGKVLFPELAMFMIYLIMVVVLAIKPSGIMGRLS